MDIIHYKGSRALLLDSEDLAKMNQEVITPTEAAVRYWLKEEVLGVDTLIVVTSSSYDLLPEFLRSAGEMKKINCFRLR